MSEKLKDYQVLDVLRGGTFYKVRHKVTNKIFAWKAFNCSTFSNEQVQNVVNEVKTIRKVVSVNLLRYYDTILHAPSKTLYFVLQYNSWQSLEELLAVSKATDKYIAESFIWYLLHELTSVCKAVEDLNLVVLRKSVKLSSIFVGEGCELRVNCFDMTSITKGEVMRQVGDVIYSLCYRTDHGCPKISEFHYSDDLRDVINLLMDERNAELHPDVLLYHPTVLANLDTLTGPKNLSEILISSSYPYSEVNKCDSEKVVELCKPLEPAPRKVSVEDSPIYLNVSPNKKKELEIKESMSNRSSLSPTVAALALELPGFVPRSRKPFSQALTTYNCAEQITEETLGQQWLSRLVALRQREESLNKRERDLIAKEMVNSPTTKFIPLKDYDENIIHIPLRDPAEEVNTSQSNGITLPPVITHVNERNNWVNNRNRRRSSSVRTRNRRKSFAYEDLDSSLSADPGDGSVIITAAKITKENMPRRNIFPDIATKKVHFTSVNPFMESDESVTLTFYELEHIDQDGYQVPKNEQKAVADINTFKYLDLEKVTSEKRAAMQQWNHSSPSKQAKVTKNALANITNQYDLKRTPSKSSIISKTSNTSRYSKASTKSVESCHSKTSDGTVSQRTRASMRMSLAPPTPAHEAKKTKSRKSLIPFKTPFKFMSSRN